MKISLSQVKNILMEIRDFEFFNDEFDLMESILLIEEEKLNTICRIITGEKEDYCADIFGENGAAEIISSFFENILDKWQKSKNFRPLILKFLPKKLLNILESQEIHK